MFDQLLIGFDRDFEPTLGEGRERLIRFLQRVLLIGFDRDFEPTLGEGRERLIRFLQRVYLNGLSLEHGGYGWGRAVWVAQPSRIQKVRGTQPPRRAPGKRCLSVRAELSLSNYDIGVVETLATLRQDRSLLLCKNLCFVLRRGACLLLKGV